MNKLHLGKIYQQQKKKLRKILLDKLEVSIYQITN
jgi:hypothetical protein